MLVDEGRVGDDVAPLLADTADAAEVARREHGRHAAAPALASPAVASFWMDSLRAIAGCIKTKLECLADS